MFHDPMRLYRAKRDGSRKTISSKYTIQGFISSGTYGRVYKAQARLSEGGDESKSGAGGSVGGADGGADGVEGSEEGSLGKVYAIKKFKPDKEGEVVTYTGISQSAIREIMLNRELDHINVVALREVILDDKSIYMVFEYADHDFLQIIHHFSSTLRTAVPVSLLKSCIHQLLNGLVYLHTCHILHRDLKPANILITSSGVVKIGDLGLARLTHSPLQPLYTGDKVVVTIWYRAPELLLGARHYNKAVDVWAVGCVMAELVSLRPIFKGEEAKLDQKKNVPFQRDQLVKIFEMMGSPNEADWPSIKYFPEYSHMQSLEYYPSKFNEWCNARLRMKDARDLLAQLFCYNPDARITAAEAFHHKWFREEPRPTLNAFHGLPHIQVPPTRRITQEEGGQGLVTHPNNNNNNMAGAGSRPTSASVKAGSGGTFGMGGPAQPPYTMSMATVRAPGSTHAVTEGSRKKQRLQ